MMRRHLQRGAAIVAVALVAVLAVAAPASAHVTVNPSTATQGGYTKVAFRVPNERADASTVSVEINIPAETPIASVSLKPVPGWTVVAAKEPLPTPVVSDDGDQITEAVQKITWTASPGSEIQPGQFQEFEVSLGPLPEVEQIVFKALQTYSSGEVVRWIGEPGDEAENPAPVLHLAAASATTPSDEGSGSTGWALGLGVAGTLIGIGGLAIGYLAYRRTAA